MKLRAALLSFIIKEPPSLRALWQTLTRFKFQSHTISESQHNKSLPEKDCANIQSHTIGESQHDRRWAHILQGKDWANKIRDQELDLVILAQNIDDALDTQAHTLGPKPYLAIAVVRRPQGPTSPNLFLEEFPESLAVENIAQNISHETLDVEFPKFTLNVAGVFEFGQGLILPKIDPIVKDDRAQALYYTKPGVHSVETQSYGSNTISLNLTADMDSILIRDAPLPHQRREDRSRIVTHLLKN